MALLDEYFIGECTLHDPITGGHAIAVHSSRMRIPPENNPLYNILLSQPLRLQNLPFQVEIIARPGITANPPWRTNNVCVVLRGLAGYCIRPEGIEFFGDFEYVENVQLMEAIEEYKSFHSIS